MKEIYSELQKQTCIKIKTRNWYWGLWCTIHLVNGLSLKSSNTKKNTNKCVMMVNVGFIPKHWHCE